MSPGSDLAALIQSVPLFSDIGGGDLEELESLLVPCDCAEGDVLFRQGDPADRVFLIVSGAVAVRAGAPAEGEVTLVEAAGRGSILGEMALNQSMQHEATATAKSDLATLTLDVETFAGLRRSRRPIAWKILRRLARQMSQRLRDVTRALSTNFGSTGANADEATGALARAPSAPDGEARVPEGRYVEFLRVLPFFRHFDEASVRQLLGSMRQWQLKRGALICEEASHATSCFIVVRGAVEITSRSEHRPAQRFGVVGPGRMVGEVSLLEPGPRTATCVAREDAVLLELGQEALDRFLEPTSSLAFPLLEALNANLIAAQLRTNAYGARLAAEHPGGPHDPLP